MSPVLATIIAMTRQIEDLPRQIDQITSDALIRQACALVAFPFDDRQCFVGDDLFGWAPLDSGAKRHPPWRRMRDLHNLKNGFALGTEDGRFVEIEKSCVAAQAAALHAEFGFGHFLIPSGWPRGAGKSLVE